MLLFNTTKQIMLNNVKIINISILTDAIFVRMSSGINLNEINL